MIFTANDKQPKPTKEENKEEKPISWEQLLGKK